MFVCTWNENRRTPASVTLPDGRVWEVSYMRDGLCLFKNGRSATYERKGEREVLFNLIVTFEQVKEAAEDYMARRSDIEKERDA